MKDYKANKHLDAYISVHVACKIGSKSLSLYVNSTNFNFAVKN